MCSDIDRTMLKFRRIVHVFSSFYWNLTCGCEYNELLWKVRWNQKALNNSFTCIMLRSESSSCECAKLRAVVASSKIETTRRDHSIIACWHHLHMDAILNAHPVRDIANATSFQPKVFNNCKAVSMAIVCLRDSFILKETI